MFDLILIIIFLMAYIIAKVFNAYSLSFFVMAINMFIYLCIRFHYDKIYRANGFVITDDMKSKFFLLRFSKKNPTENEKNLRETLLINAILRKIVAIIVCLVLAINSFQKENWFNINKDTQSNNVEVGQKLKIPTANNSLDDEVVFFD